MTSDPVISSLYMTHRPCFRETNRPGNRYEARRKLASSQCNNQDYIKNLILNIMSNSGGTVIRAQ
jgi:hypothetical protein